MAPSYLVFQLLDRSLKAQDLTEEWTLQDGLQEAQLVSVRHVPAFLQLALQALCCLQGPSFVYSKEKYPSITEFKRLGESMKTPPTPSETLK